jgi:RHS repeat-associated protein
VYETYTYDKNGSLTNITGNRTLALTWDAHNRTSQIQVGAITPYSYQYDINSYRIAKNLNTIFNNYYLENGKLESIYDNNGNVQAKYMRGSVIDEVVNGYQNNSGAMTNYTYHHDALESVLGQSGNTGSVVAAQGYTSFGSTVNATGSSNNTLKFTGREQDSETGLYYYRARYYDPLTGRFISEDPIGSGINFYTYAGNNPINTNDPTGNCGPCIQTARTILTSGVGIGAVSGAIGGYISGGSEGAVIGGALGSITGYAGAPLAGWLVQQGTWGAIASMGVLPTIGGVSGMVGAMGTNWWTGNNIMNGVPTAGLAGFTAPLASAEAFVFVGSVSEALATGFSWVTSVYNITFAYIDPNSNFGYKTSNKSTATQNTSKTTQQSGSGSSSNSSAVSQAVNAAFAAQINSAMDSVNSIINTPTPAAPPISMPSSGTTYPLPPEPDFNGEYISAADGGFILYPNMSNTSQIQRVYSKH